MGKKDMEEVEEGSAEMESQNKVVAGRGSRETTDNWMQKKLEQLTEHMQLTVKGPGRRRNKKGADEKTILHGRSDQEYGDGGRQANNWDEGSIGGR